ncbi:class I SAM-dependent methyltransferase [Sorangium sp. So ce124]|uniref:class I SAM-dependent methyltransferase n=1 Tax=Sorangium sp. So ce124 TaxID=3133280 RepID=UPI003F609230
MSEADWFALNRAAWNARTRVHLASQFYDLASFRAGASSLKPIELEQVGDVRGKTLLHLQCHFGQDTLSWARLGARVTGLDLSDEAITAARALAKELSVDARFVEANVYDAPEALGGETFDIVFTSYGVLGWLPDMKRWARAAAACLKPGGVLHLIEFHPLVWTFDNAFEQIAYAYDGHGEPIVTEETGTYADRSAPVTLKEVGFNHGIGTVVSALLDAGLTLERLRELDWSPYDIFPDMVEGPPGEFRMKKFERRLPLVYALAARRRP